MGRRRASDPDSLAAIPTGLVEARLMQYHADSEGAVQLTLTANEAQRLEDFIHLAAMALMTWPIVAGEYMTERKAARERRPQGLDPPST